MPRKIVVIEQKIDKLIELIESNEVKQLRKDSDELKELKNLLKPIHFKIKSIKVVENQETSRPRIVVTYELPTVVLDLDENGVLNKDEFFYSTNMLDMISLEDMGKFQEVLNKLTKTIKK